MSTFNISQASYARLGIVSKEKGRQIRMEAGIHPPHPAPHPQKIHVIVEVNGKDVPITFDHSPVTGAEIRAAAHAPPDDDLSRLEHGKPTGGNIEPDGQVPIKNGDHFIALPAGTVS
jgi:hypothetical protein